MHWKLTNGKIPHGNDKAVKGFHLRAQCGVCATFESRLIKFRPRNGMNAARIFCSKNILMPAASVEAIAPTAADAAPPLTAKTPNARNTNLTKSLSPRRASPAHG